jgi:hypothetical protein
MNGGYYRYDLKDNVSILCLNSILMNSKNSQTESQSVKDQLSWLEAQLQDETRKFILQMHIPPGHWYQLGEEVYWKDEFMDSYLGLFTKYNDRIKLMMSAHAHPGEVRAPVSARYPKLSLPIAMNPSISPIGLMNPSYSILDMPKGASPYLVWRSLNLFEYHVTQLHLFTTIDPQSRFNLSLSSTSSIREFTASLGSSLPLFGDYLFTKMGYPEWMVQIISPVWQLAMPYIGLFDHHKFVCGMLHFEDLQYQQCTQANGRQVSSKWAKWML